MQMEYFPDIIHFDYFILTLVKDLFYKTRK